MSHAIPSSVLLVCTLATMQMAGLAIWHLAKRPQTVASIALVTYSLLLFMIQYPSVTFGVTIYLPDALFVCILAATSLRLLTSTSLTPPLIAVMLLTGLVSFSVLRGILQYDVQSAVNESRTIFYFVAGLLFFTTWTAQVRTLRRLGRIWIAFAIFFCLIAVGYWIKQQAGDSSASPWSAASVNWGNSPIRVISVGQTMFLVTALVFSVGFRMSNIGARWERSTCFVILPIVLLLQHRTPIVALLVAGLLTILLTLKNPSRILRRGIQMAPPVLLLLAVSIAIVGLPGETTIKQLTNRSTWTWRTKSWEILLDAFGNYSTMEQLFGAPFGSGYDRSMDGITVGLQPHNFYVMLLLRTGVVGVACLLFLYAYLFHSLLTHHRFYSKLSGFEVRYACVILVCQLLYYVTYPPDFEMGIVLGTIGGMTALYLSHVRRGSQHGVHTATRPDDLPQSLLPHC